MTNPRDLENGMVGDPVDDRVFFDRDCWGNTLYTCDEIYQLMVAGHEYLFNTEDANKLLQSLIIRKSEQVMTILNAQQSGNLISMLFLDSGYETALDLLADIGATVVNEGDAA